MDAITAKHAGAESDDETLSLLVETIEQLSLARTVEDIASVVLSAARRLSGADGVTFVLREGESCRYLDEEAIGPLWKGRSFPLSACISGWAMLTGQTAVIPDIYLDPRIPHDAYRPTFVRSLVMTPVRATEPLAAIGAYWAQTRTPSAAETARLAAIARATATALENVGLIASLEDSVRRRDVLIRELDHRVKNNLAVVRAIVHQTLRAAPSPQAFSAAFSGRLMALSRAHDIVQRDAGRRAGLKQLIESALEPHVEAGAGPVSILGPQVDLAAELAVNVHLAFHELAANAAQHGALTAPEGCVEVGWEVRDGRLELTWHERGGPPAAPPERDGFGLRLIRDGLPRSLGGASELVFDPEGLRVAISAPISEAIVAA